MSSVIQSYEAKELRKRPLVIKIADKLTNFFGSMWFLIFNIALFTFWIYANTGKIPGIPIFDEFPFFFLTTGVSLEAIILTIVVLVSQQRQNQIATIREELDMQVNRIAEREITKSLLILKQLADHHKIKVEDKELDEMLKGLELSYIERKLAEQIQEKPNPILKEISDVAVKIEKEVMKK